jgi:hypothetical protein
MVCRAAQPLPRCGPVSWRPLRDTKSLYLVELFASEGVAAVFPVTLPDELIDVFERRVKQVAL